MVRLAFLAALGAALSGCSDTGGGDVLPPERDPVAMQAVNDQIMTDPDLSARNEANAALTSSTDNSIPPITATREAISAARQEALELVEGAGVFDSLPSDIPATNPLPASALIGLQSMAALTPSFARCAAGLGYTAQWAVNWPGIVPLYPRSNLREAAGNTGGNCALRAASALTPVPLDDVAAFYLAKVRSEGLRATIRQKGPVYAVSAAGRGVEARIYIAPTEYGQTRIDLIVQG